jgi:hypothetical protein
MPSMNTMRSSCLTLALAAAALLCGSGATSAASWPVYRDAKLGYAISHPRVWRVDTAHDYQALGPGKDIYGTAFVVSPSTAFGTNLSDDSYLAVETLPSATTCTADLFLDDADQAGVHTETANGITWSVEHGSDAGAGNLYDETVYAVTGSKPCIAIRYFIHSTNIANYTPGTVRQFDQIGLLATFDKMRASFRLSR